MIDRDRADALEPIYWKDKGLTLAAMAKPLSTRAQHLSQSVSYSPLELVQSILSVPNLASESVQTYLAGLLAHFKKDYEQAYQHFEKATGLFETEKNYSGQALCLIEMAWLRYNESRQVEDSSALAYRIFDEAEEVINAHPDTPDIQEARARLLHYEGLAQYRSGKYGEGVSRFKEALDICEPEGLECAKILDSMGVHYERVGDLHLAHRSLERAIKIKRNIGILWEEAISAQILGRLFLIQEKYEPSLRYLKLSKKLCQTLEDNRRVESLNNSLLKLYTYERKFRQAKTLINKIERDHKALYNDSGRGFSLRSMNKEYVVTQFYKARVLFLEGQLEKSKRLLEDIVLPGFKHHKAKKDLGKSYRLLSCIYASQSNHQQTIEHMGEAVSLFRELNLVDEQAKTHFDLGQAFEDLGDKPLAIESYMEALKVCERNGLRFMSHHITEAIYHIDPVRWQEIMDKRVNHIPIFESERTLLEALTHLAEQPPQEQARREQSQTQSLISLLKVGQAISGEANVDKLLSLIMDETQRALNCDRCTVFLYDRDKNELWSRVATGGSKVQNIRFPAHLGLAGYVCKTGEVLNIKDPYDDPRFNQEIDRKTGYKTENLLCMPMKNRDNEIVGIFQVLNKQNGPFVKADEDLLMAIASQAGVSLENAQMARDQKAAFHSFIKTLSSTIDARDPITAGHSERVAYYSELIGDEMKLDKEEIETLNYSALLHDIGKIGVRESILTKEGRLTLEEYRHIQKHAEYTYDILKNIHFEKHLKNVPEIAASHHEKMDGTGYFRGLSGHEIPLLGRILALSDVFDAITSRRHYRDRMPFDRVLKILKRDSGTHFDPDIVDAFFDIPLHRLGNILLIEQRLISEELDHSFLEKIPNTLNVTINEYYDILTKAKLSKGEKLIHADFNAIYHRGQLDTYLD